MINFDQLSEYEWFRENTRFWEIERDLSLIGHLLSHFKWYRKRLGGHWEQWMIDVPVAADLWFPMRECSKGKNARPGLGRGTPICEDW